MLLGVIGYRDWRTQRIENKWIQCIFLCGIVIAMLQTEVSVLSRCIGAMVVSLPLLVIVVVWQGAIGGGDIKLLSVSGWILGSWNIVIAFCIGMLISGLYLFGSYLYDVFVKKERNRRNQIPLGPGLCVGCIVAMGCGEQILQWYCG